MAAFRTRRPEREVSLQVEKWAETFAAQPVYLGQVVRNLLSNADKYSPKATPIEIEDIEARVAELERARRSVEEDALKEVARHNVESGKASTKAGVLLHGS